jgi:hypothetical protein
MLEATLNIYFLKHAEKKSVVWIFTSSEPRNWLRQCDHLPHILPDCSLPSREAILPRNREWLVSDIRHVIFSANSPLFLDLSLNWFIIWAVGPCLYRPKMGCSRMMPTSITVALDLNNVPRI